MMNAMLEHFEGQGQAAAGAPGPEPSLSKPGTTWVSGRVRFLASPSLILRSREPPGDATFEPSRVRTFTYVCMHLHPWFEPTSSSNISITWGARPHPCRDGGSGEKRPADCLLGPFSAAAR